VIIMKRLFIIAIIVFLAALLTGRNTPFHYTPGSYGVSSVEAETAAPESARGAEAPAQNAAGRPDGPAAASQTSMPDNGTESNDDNNDAEQNKARIYEVYVGGALAGSFATYGGALSFASGREKAAVKYSDKSGPAPEICPEYSVDIPGGTLYFQTFARAAEYSRELAKDPGGLADGRAAIRAKGSGGPIWSAPYALPEQKRVDGVPVISQNPELARGCEVTSLAMLLQFWGIDTDKTRLAEEIKKDATPFARVNGQIHYGNPNDGFVGDIYSLCTCGLGVYHGPVAELCARYAPGVTHDITGADFDDALYFVANGLPVWVISNGYFTALPDSYFETWITPEGPIKITYDEHSVVITGYDADNIYINDPLSGKLAIPRGGFIAAWEQMGSQAVVIVPDQEKGVAE